MLQKSPVKLTVGDTVQVPLATKPKPVASGFSNQTSQQQSGWSQGWGDSNASNNG